MSTSVLQVLTFAGSFIGMMLLFYIVIKLIAYCNKDKQKSTSDIEPTDSKDEQDK